jgi:ferritin-like metal-binding protein YciE
MKPVIEKLPNLRAMYIKQLRLLLSAEEQIVRGLPAMIDVATDLQLKQVLQSHLKESEVQVMRLRKILSQIAGEAEPLKCRVLMALVDEIEDMVEDSSHVAVRDAALITGVQRIEHYEMAAYGGARHFAHVLGRDGDAELLDQSLQEERGADHLFTSIADRVNPEAKKAA